jgi:hypothetical protein
MSPFVLFLIFLAIIAVVLFAIWRYWASLARVTPEEQEFDERIAALNERQANRLSDEQLTRNVSDDDAWQIMVRRGMRDRERRRRPRDTGRRLLPPRDPEPRQPRRERYGGDMLRRVDERRSRRDDER